ncbi:MAG: flagellar biosynthesis protein FlhB, partial [Planctomycetes bacterium]|nr:flagellar biosynthesis protein FlhB [Planctomycetota bacterium]
MAESGQEKTEQATPKRREEAAQRGQIGYSKEVSSAALFLGGLIVLKMAGDQIVLGLLGKIDRSFRLPIDLFPDDDPAPFLTQTATDFFFLLLPVFVVAMVSILGPGLMQTGLKLATKRIQPELSKLNPLNGIKKLFSQENLISTLQSLIKMILVGIVCWITIASRLDRLLALADAPLGSIVETILDVLFLMSFRVAGGLLLIGTIDLFYRRWKLSKDLMMTKEDVKEERKKSEGDPKVKAKIKEIQRSLALQRMFQDIKTADVVVRNPTHFAIALRYDRGRDPAPKVVAKGKDKLALRIIDVAREHGVEVIENRPLARDLYRSVRLGDFVPERLFKAVAQILAYVYGKKQKRRRAAAA